MTVKRQALRIAALATAFVVAACGGAGATTTPVQPTPTDAAPSFDRSTFDLSSLDLSSFDLGSFAIPSFVGNEELEALLPDTIGGQPVTKQSVNGQAFIDLGMGAAFEDILADVGATPSDLGVAIGTAGSVEIRAYQIEGQSAEQIFAGLVAAFQAGGAGTVTEIAVGGRTVSQVTTSAETSYAYLSGDVVFIVGGSVTSELLEDAVSQLPAP